VRPSGVRGGRRSPRLRPRVRVRVSAGFVAGALTLGVVGAGAGAGAGVGVVAAGAAGAASAASNANALGAPDPATGSPVTVAVIIDAGPHLGGTGPLVAQGAKAAVDYLNKYGGGLAGHKIDLYVCENQETPAGGRACGTDVAQKHAVAVTVPFTGEGTTEVPTIVAAGIPFITLTGASTAELTTPGAFSIEGGLASDLGAIALDAKRRHYQKVVFLVADQAAAVQGAQVLGQLVFHNAGVGFEVIPANAGTADMTPQLRAAINAGASAVALLGNQSLCGSFLQAYTKIRTHLPRYLLATCQDPSILDSPSLDREFKGSYIVGPNTATAKDDALYAAIVHKFTPGVNPDPSASANEAAGLTAVLALSSVMAGYPRVPTLTASAVLHQVEQAQGVVIPFSNGQTFTCDGKAIARLPSVCSSTAAVGVVGSGYTVKDVSVLNPGELF
jgi:branched-chain amino acid transport system substrate-binding protein